MTGLCSIRTNLVKKMVKNDTVAQLTGLVYDGGAMALEDIIDPGV